MEPAKRFSSTASMDFIIPRKEKSSSEGKILLVLGLIRELKWGFPVPFRRSNSLREGGYLITFASAAIFISKQGCSVVPFTLARRRGRKLNTGILSKRKSLPSWRLTIF